MNIQQTEQQVAQKLNDALKNALNESGYSIPAGYRPQVKLKDAHGRKKRSDASAENWSPETDQIVIQFEPSSSEELASDHNPEPLPSPHPAVPYAKPAHGGVWVHPGEEEVLRALDRAESKPGWTFVPLKKFRDEILPLEECPSLRTDVEREHMLRSAIEKRLIVVGKVANPKAPQFPVTTVRVNRLLPEVIAALGTGTAPGLDFRPIEIAGEPLSATVLRERR